MMMIQKMMSSLVPRITTSTRILSTSCIFRQSSDNETRLSRRDYRFVFPEFLPDPNPKFRNPLSEKLQRKDMLTRRELVEIPEFYVGSVMAVTVSDPSSPHPNKQSRFVGTCIARGGTGIRAWFILRNVVEGQGVEFMYNMYSPTVVKVEVIRLEKRLDEELYYLRDAPLEYSAVPLDLDVEILPEGSPVPVNKTVVKLHPPPWLSPWEVQTAYLDGYELTDPFSTPGKVRRQERKFSEGSIHWQQQVLEFDLMRDYRNTITVEEQDQVWDEVGDKLEERDKQMRKVAAKRAFIRPVKKI